MEAKVKLKEVRPYTLSFSFTVFSSKFMNSIFYAEKTEKLSMK